MDKNMQERKHNSAFKIPSLLLILPLILYIVLFLYFNTWYFLTFTQIPLAKIEKKLFKTPHPYSLMYPNFCYLNLLKSKSNYDFNMNIWYYKEIVDNNLVTEKKEKLSYILHLICTLNDHQRYANAIKYEEQAFTALHQCYSRSEHFSLLINLAKSYSMLNKFNKAEIFYINAQKFVNENEKSIDEKLPRLELLFLKANLYEAKKDYLNAEKIYWQSEKYILSVFPIDKFFIENIKYELCNLYRTNKINSTKSHNYNKLCKEENE